MPLIITTLPGRKGHAVESADDARRAIIAAGDAHGAWIGGGRLHQLVESGGTVGPLPDGTSIDVRRVGWDHFGQFAQCQARPLEHQQILDAYNG